MADKPRKNEEADRKKPRETKYYHTEEEAALVDERVRQGRFKNRQHYMRELIRRDTPKKSR